MPRKSSLVNTYHSDPMRQVTLWGRDCTAGFHAFIWPVAKEHCWWCVHGAMPKALLCDHAERPFISAPPRQMNLHRIAWPWLSTNSFASTPVQYSRVFPLRLHSVNSIKSTPKQNVKYRNNSTHSCQPYATTITQRPEAHIEEDFQGRHQGVRRSSKMAPGL
jgi:hypothetical protein